MFDSIGGVFWVSRTICTPPASTMLPGLGGPREKPGLSNAFTTLEDVHLWIMDASRKVSIASCTELMLMQGAGGDVQ